MKLFKLRKLIRQLHESELELVTVYTERVLASRPKPVMERFGAVDGANEVALPHDWNTVSAFGSEK